MATAPKPVPESGTRFGLWTVIGGERYTSVRTPVRQTLCRCDCGTKRWVSLTALRNDHSKSCGCRSKQAHTKLIQRYQALPKDFTTA